MNSEELKSKGNQAFSSGDYAQAIAYFTDAISIDPSNHILYSNRSASYASLRNYEAALEDAIKLIQLKPDWPKVFLFISKYNL